MLCRNRTGRGGRNMSYAELRMRPTGVMITLIRIKAGDQYFMFTNDNMEHTYKGNVYLPHFYEVGFPGESENSDNTGEIKIMHTDELFAAMRQNRSDIKLFIDCEYIGADGRYNNAYSGILDVTDISKTDVIISAGLKVKTVFDLSFPSPLMTMVNCPGLL